jgi:dipeptidyl aminopeptidase/acylaminoacyl peptidase
MMRRASLASVAALVVFTLAMPRAAGLRAITGHVDPNGLGVTGGGGGGLLTDRTITQTPRFIAAVAQRDIADWSGSWYTADFTLFTPTWFRKAPWEDPQDFAARSPITHVANVTTPLMLVDQWLAGKKNAAYTTQ